MKILLTGGTGYLGGTLVEELKKENEICVLVRESSNTEYLKSIENLSIIKNNEEMKENLIKFMPNIVIHTACLYEKDDNSIESLVDANLLFPIKLLEICIEIGIKTWINTSTALSECTNTYSLSKHQFSMWGKYLAEQRLINFYDLELESFYGYNQPETYFISYLIDNLRKNNELSLSLGTQRRDFIAITDVINVYKKVMNLKIDGYYMIPVGTGISPSIREVVIYLKDLIGSNSYLNFGAIPQRENEQDSCCDISIMDEFGINSFIEWKLGMKKLTENYRESF